MNTILQLPTELVIETVLNSKTKSEVFRKLECYRNSKNIKELNKIITKYNLNLNASLDTTLKINQNTNLKYNKVICPYCNNLYKASGIDYHIRYCKLNPNKEIHYGNYGKTKGYPIWNKGLTIATSEAILRLSQSLKEHYVQFPK